MNVTKSLPLSFLTLTLNCNNDQQTEHSLITFDENSNDSIPSITTSNPNIACCCHRCHEKRSGNIKHEFVCVKRYQSASSRRSIGRCFKRGKSSNKTARKLKTKGKNIRQQLKQQVRELEFQQNFLLTEVNNLYLYKQQLEVQYEQTNINN